MQCMLISDKRAKLPKNIRIMIFLYMDPLKWIEGARREKNQWVIDLLTPFIPVLIPREQFDLYWASQNGHQGLLEMFNHYIKK